MLDHFSAASQLLRECDDELAHLNWTLARLQTKRDALDGKICNMTNDLETLKQKFVAYKSIEWRYGCDPLQEANVDTLIKQATVDTLI